MGVGPLMRDDLEFWGIIVGVVLVMVVTFLYIIWG